MELDRLIKKLIDLPNAVKSSLESEVAEVAKESLSQSARKNVLDVYDPLFYSRREHGGIDDTETMTATATTDDLTVTADAPWQHLYGGHYPDTRLAEAIGAGEKRFYMGRPGPRPFHQPAEHEVYASGKAERALMEGLRRQGY